MHVKLSNLVMINFSVSIFDGCIPKMTPVLSNKEQKPTQPYCNLEDLSCKSENTFCCFVAFSCSWGKFLWIKNQEAHGSQFSNEKRFLPIKKLKQSHDYTTRGWKKPHTHYFHFEKRMVFYLYNLNPSHPRILCANFGWNWPCGYGEVFKMSSMYVHYVAIKASICKNFNSGWNWPRGPWGEAGWQSEQFTTTMMTTDNGQIFIRKAHYSSRPVIVSPCIA